MHNLITPIVKLTDEFENGIPVEIKFCPIFPLDEQLYHLVTGTRVSDSKENDAC